MPLWSAGAIPVVMLGAGLIAAGLLPQSYANQKNSVVRTKSILPPFRHGASDSNDWDGAQGRRLALDHLGIRAKQNTLTDW